APATAPARARAHRGRRARDGGRPRSRLKRLLQLLEALVADPVDLTQLVDRAEAPVRLPVLDDPLGQRGPDPVEGVELVRRRGGQAHGPLAAPRGARARVCATRAGTRDDHL